MLTVDGPDAEAALLDWVRAWFDLLAADRLTEACARLDEPAGSGAAWTPAALAGVLAAAFGPETRFAAAHPEGPRFTSPHTAASRERGAVGAFADGTGFWLGYDVPLNGAFGDLTAQFEFRWRAPRVLAARLYDLHVL